MISLQTSTLGVMATPERQNEYLLVVAAINAAMRNRGDMLAEVTCWFDPTEISDPYFRKLFMAIEKMFTSGTPISDYTLASTLPLEEDEVFGNKAAQMYGFLVDSSGQAGNILHYARCVHDAYRRLNASEEITITGELVKDAPELDLTLDELPRIRGKYAPAPSGRGVHSQNPFQDIISELEGGRSEASLTFGMDSLDDIVELNPGRLTTVAAKSGQGKSCLLGQTALRCANQLDKPVLFFTFEMSDQEVIKRWASMLSRQPFKGGDRKRYLEGLARIQSLVNQKRLLKVHTEGRTVEQIRGEVLGYTRTNPLGLIVVDYIQIVSPTQSKDANREQQVAHIVENLKAIAMDSKTPLLTATQLNDDGKVRESRAIFHASDGLVEISPDETSMEKSESPVTLSVIKNRNGRNGRSRAIWEKPIYTMREKELEEMQNYDAGLANYG